MQLYEELHKTVGTRQGMTPSESVRLTRRELEVLSLIATGSASKSVADALFLSKRTIDFHLNNIFEKFDVNCRMLALRKARKLGILPFEP